MRGWAWGRRPEEGAVRLVMFAAMAGLLVVALLTLLIGYELIRFAGLRDRLRHQVAHEAA